MPRTGWLVLLPLMGCALRGPAGPTAPRGAVAGGAPLATADIELAAPAEVLLAVPASCGACSWSRAGREGAVLRVEVDGAYSQHVVVPGGTSHAARVVIGPLGAGAHRVAIVLDPATPEPVRDSVTVGPLETIVVAADAPEYAAVAHTPILHARPGSLERFSDLPMVMWYGVESSPRGTWLRYSVVFTNEDGGTPPDRLMATWGRATDIEYVFGVELDAAGRVLAEEYQGPDHRYLAFAGEHVGRHPVLHVVTVNNMVAERGGAPQRFAPAPLRLAIDHAAREAVMDAAPWLYRVSSEELAREGRVDPAARPGSGKVPDPRRFVYVEACGETAGAALALDAGFADGSGTLAWAPSDGGLPDFRIVLEHARQRIERPGGCFRAAVAAPAGAGPLQALRFRAHTLPPRAGETPAPGSARARLTRINKVFLLDDEYVPGANLLEWKGEMAVPPDDQPVEFRVVR
jgi:hypothetical protein